MLQLKSITKVYGRTSESGVVALRDVDLNFRKSEFVSILGPSGCGKTTLLNVIGGLDKYTRGDLIINGRSTKEFRDADWDAYRNHSVGFVFQNYNLIPHQTVLSNVELALTLSGVSKSERRVRAEDALRKVGLDDQLHKKPNQMSGGQMQRVAIARALVNDPEILLADEPTGALDSTTSVQIMELLKEISKDRLVIMVTHNPELAEQYSTRIIRLLDGRVTDDSAPSSPEEEKEIAEKPIMTLKEQKKAKEAKTKRTSMSFLTALSLSFNNLMTKKARTFLTSFAGSIGIIGIALILSVSTGVQAYINSVQRDTLASYPLQLRAESTDLSALIGQIMQTNQNNAAADRELDRVYESSVVAELMNSFNSAKVTTNDLKSFKEHLESTAAFKDYLTAVQYTYDFRWSVLTEDADGHVIKSDATELIKAMYGGAMMGDSSSSAMNSAMTDSFNVWQEMLTGEGDNLVNGLIKDEYDLIYGNWPTAYNEVMLVVNKNNEISDLSLYALGLRTEQEILEAMQAASKGEILDTSDLGSWSYEELCAMNFRLFLQSECYQKNLSGIYEDISKTDDGLAFLYNNADLGIDLKISGIIRPNADASSSILTGTIAYTAALTDYAIDKTANSTLLQDQISQPEVDVLTRLPFKDDAVQEPTAEEKKAAVQAYLSGLLPAQQLEFCKTILCTPTEAQIKAAFDAQVEAAGGIRPLAIGALMQTGQYTAEEAQQMIASMDDAALEYNFYNAFKQTYPQQYAAEKMAELEAMTNQQLMMTIGEAFASMSDEDYAAIYDTHLPQEYSDSTYQNNLTLLGFVDKASPAGINLYCATFENKDAIAALIDEYNGSVGEEQKISYTDYVALMMSSITTIIDAISYVLIAFVAISLVVSSIMIGIITYISVLERTKEIGILRAIGASKGDISLVFNAETLTVGFVAGAIGIIVTLLLILLINIILFALTGIPNLQAVLPVGAALILVVISMALTFIAGLFPSRIAAKKDPVVALRTE